MGLKLLSQITLLWLSFCLFHGNGAAFRCEKEIFFIKTEFDCPRPGDPDNYVFCCGDDDNKHCCKFPIGDIEVDQETVDAIVESIPKILGILFGVVVVAFLVCIVCCCCCPFCLFAKKRRAGQVHRGADVTITMPPQQAAQPLQPYPNQPQQGYPAQPQPGYPTQPQPGYPAAGYPSAAPAPAPGYPEQPPPYSEKQPAFNPNYAS